MKKFLLAGVVILSSIAYVFVVRAQTPATIPTPITTSTDTSTDAAVTPTSNPVVPSNPVSVPIAVPVVTPKPKPVPVPTPTPVQTGQFKNGTYTGSVADAYYGNIQVAAVISGGKLTNVKILEYPNDRQTSIEINQQALPILIQEAIRAQSSRVDGVSGASDTSAAFVESLHTALLSAQA